VSDRAAARTAAVVLLLVGILGFVPGVTSHARLFGELRVSALLNLVHVALGVVALVRPSAVGLALASLGLWLLGVLAAGGWLSLDTAENWLHFTLGVALLGATAVAGRAAVRPAVS
jgi:hypothetical protein